LETPPSEPAVIFPDTALPPSGTGFFVPDPEIPEMILKMRRMYEYSDGSFALKCKNFCRQGKFMEDYEDDAPWDGVYHQYFPTYHDLNTKQLRGYFTWRTRLRNGDFTPIPTSMAYIYVYELLNGIGTRSPEDTLVKLRSFEKGFLDSGIGDRSMKKNLRRWMLEYAVLHDISPEEARQYADHEIIKKDAALAALKKPDDIPDEEIFSALCFFYGKKLDQSPVVSQDIKRGEHLFASVWRRAMRGFSESGKDLFTACFGKSSVFSWHPLGNALYFMEGAHPDSDYVLDPCRQYRCRKGMWQEKRYENLFFDADMFHALLHAADNVFRKAFKTGRLLKENPKEEWAARYAEEVLRDEEKKRQEALIQNITIDAYHLEKIRQDARITQDSLLTEEYSDVDPVNILVPDRIEDQAVQTGPEECLSGSKELSSLLPDPAYRQILAALINGKLAEPYLKSDHLMASVAADSINEVLFDEIGDNVLECDGDSIILIDDYADDIRQLIGG
jgi:hypothetical protein